MSEEHGTVIELQTTINVMRLELDYRQGHISLLDAVIENQVKRIKKLEAQLIDEKLVTNSYNITVKELRKKITELEACVERMIREVLADIPDPDGVRE